METENKNIRTLADHLDKRYGKEGTESRINFEAKATSFAVEELRIEANKKILISNIKK